MHTSRQTHHLRLILTDLSQKTAYVNRPICIAEKIDNASYHRAGKGWSVTSFCNNLTLKENKDLPK